MVTLREVQRALEADEPDYARAASLFGADALDHLAALAQTESDPLTASKAVYLASTISDPRAVDILIEAAESREDIVRLAVAGGARNLREDDCSRVLVRLVEDQDYGVQRLVMASASEELKSKFRQQQAGAGG